MPGTILFSSYASAHWHLTIIQCGRNYCDRYLTDDKTEALEKLNNLTKVTATAYGNQILNLDNRIAVKTKYPKLEKSSKDGYPSFQSHTGALETHSRNSLFFRGLALMTDPLQLIRVFYISVRVDGNL